MYPQCIPWVSAPLPPVSASAKSHTAKRPARNAGDDEKKPLQEVGKKLFVLYAPWPSWSISGCWVAGAPATGNITATDDGGREILSYVPLPLVADFLSSSGQSLVSSCGNYFLRKISGNWDTHDTEPSGKLVTLNWWEPPIT